MCVLRYRTTKGQSVQRVKAKSGLEAYPNSPPIRLLILRNPRAHNPRVVVHDVLEDPQLLCTTTAALHHKWHLPKSLDRHEGSRVQGGIVSLSTPQKVLHLRI